MDGQRTFITTYICTCIHMEMLLCRDIYIEIYISEIYLCPCIYRNRYTHIYIYIYIYMYMYIYTYVYVPVYVYLYIYGIYLACVMLIFAVRMHMHSYGNAVMCELTRKNYMHPA